MGPLGWQETVFIFVLALLVFGPKKLPELGKTVGKALTEFRRASTELKSTWDREMVNLERENESLKEVTQNYASEINNDYNYDDSSYYDSGAYGSESNDSTATTSSSVGASATQGAESTAEAAQEGESIPSNGSGEIQEVAGAADSSGDSESDAAMQQASTGQPASEPKTLTS